MIRIRPYKISDADAILSWCQNEKAFYQWTAGIIGGYPASKAEFAQLNKLMQFTALDEKEVVGYFTARNPKDTLDELRFGFVIVRPDKRGKGYGKAGIKLALDFIKTWPCGKAEYCVISYEPENEAAKNLYASFGFEENGEMADEEVVAVLKL